MPAEGVGKLVMTREVWLFRGTDDDFRAALAAGGIRASRRCLAADRAKVTFLESAKFA